MSKADIEVETVEVGVCRVTVTEGASSTTHTVRIDREEPGVDPERLVEASFRFLLDREPKESILARFDLSIITRYFPDYSDRIGDYL